jgi:hypothetical protein
MASSSVPPILPPSVPSQQLVVTADMLQFLRDESDKHRQAMRDDGDANRKLLKDSLQLVAIPLTVLIAVAGFLGFRSVSDLKQGIQAEAERQTKQEVSKMEGQIRDTLNSQFQSDKLRLLVKEAAKDATTHSAQPLIKSEVSSQVRIRVSAEEPTIRENVKKETQAAVQDMNGRIQGIVESDVNSKVTSQVQPALIRLNQAEELEELITRMNSGDATAFDLIISNQYLNTLNPESRATAIGAARRVIHDAQSGIVMTRNFNTPMNHEQLVQLLNSPDADNRQASLDTLTGSSFDSSTIAKVEELAEHDPSLTVREAATRCFNLWTKQNFEPLNRDPLAAWWQQNRSKFASAGK